MSHRWQKWGHVKSAADFIPKGQGPYNSVLWNGKYYISYITAGNRPGRLDIADVLNARLKANLGRHYIFGFWADNSEERLDETLKKARTLSVRPNTEFVGQSECYVLDATVETGQGKVSYTVWLDPKHGYSTAKLESKKQRSVSRFDNVQFEKTDGVWVTKYANFSRRCFFDGGEFTNEVYQIKVTEMKLNPDHDALGSFLANDIREGARVGFLNDIKSATPVNTRMGPYKWKDGNVVDTSEQIVLKPSEE